MVLLDVFRESHDVYLDYPFEEVMFRWEYVTRKVFRKFYGEAEVEIDHASNLFHDAISTGELITADQYAQGKPPDQERTLYRLEVIGAGNDVYLDYPLEHVMFRWDHKSKKVFRKSYRETEVEIDCASKLLSQALSAGKQITAQRYAQGLSCS